MKPKWLLIIFCITSICFIIYLVAPVGDDLYSDYLSSMTDIYTMFNSKEQFRKEYTEMLAENSGNNTSGSNDSGNTSGGSVNVTYTSKFVPAEADKDLYQAWLNSIDIPPERKAIIQACLNTYQSVSYGYGGAGRNHYKEPDFGKLPIDCSGTVCFAYYQAGIDIGMQATGGLYSLVSPNKVDPANAKPGDIVVRQGHAELYVGQTEAGIHVTIGSGSGQVPKLRFDNWVVTGGNKAVPIVGPSPQLKEIDNKYYGS